MEYKDMSLLELEKYARASSGELTSLGEWLFDNETGKYHDFRDEDTTLFLASARNIVIELCRRLKELTPPETFLCPNCHGSGKNCELCHEEGLVTEEMILAFSYEPCPDDEQS